jgi:hypothetical protein
MTAVFADGNISTTPTTDEMVENVSDMQSATWLATPLVMPPAPISVSLQHGDRTGRKSLQSGSCSRSPVRRRSASAITGQAASAATYTVHQCHYPCAFAPYPSWLAFNNAMPERELLAHARRVVKRPRGFILLAVLVFLLLASLLSLKTAHRDYTATHGHHPTGCRERIRLYRSALNLLESFAVEELASIKAGNNRASEQANCAQRYDLPSQLRSPTL